MSKKLWPIILAMVASCLIGVCFCFSIIHSNAQVTPLVMLAGVGMAAALVWWTPHWLNDFDERMIPVASAPSLPPLDMRYAVPEDIAALLDEHAHCVAGMADLATRAIDNEIRLRERMGSLSAYMTEIEDDRELLRVEAEKIREIQAVAARTPRLTAKTSPDDYGIKRPQAAQDEALPAPLAFLIKEPLRPTSVDLTALEGQMAGASG